ncbi:hypothetical protein BKA82DRAFT_23569 [Pisolithus tinctorius]|uniref:Uncharacterized protein n=1 Tax=Pisolithus tinctorius Marx 270 TaxID=870435 RepID=A0A0C3PI27_PISTI|nr:hypothetical protein BKA82DRAFT_23569 [Pisolithus tinctorius]KIO07709.1 hypothetical protein M404DRAFT_23569 [Pisolithus tinctorius Marx 270]
MAEMANGLRWRRIGITPVSLVPFFAPVLVLVVFGLAYANTKPLLYRNGTLFRHWDCSSSVPVSDEAAGGPACTRSADIEEICTRSGKIRAKVGFLPAPPTYLGIDSSRLLHYLTLTVVNQ